MKSGRSNPKVIVLLVGLVVVVVYLLVWRPRVADVADAQANRDALTTQLAHLDATLAASATPATVPASARWPSMWPYPRRPSCLRSCASSSRSPPTPASSSRR